MFIFEIYKVSFILNEVLFCGYATCLDQTYLALDRIVCTPFMTRNIKEFSSLKWDCQQGNPLFMHWLQVIQTTLIFGMISYHIRQLI